jgi:uracil-DNA glycosylase
VRPRALVLLGATAGKALLGARFRLGDARGSRIDSDLADLVTATIHPSAILRTTDDQARREARRAFVADLRRVAKHLAADR